MFRKIIVAWAFAIVTISFLASPHVVWGSQVLGCVAAFPPTEIEAVLVDSIGREVALTRVGDDSCFGFRTVPSGSYYVQLRGQFIETGRTQTFQISGSDVDLGGFEPNPTIAAAVAILHSLAAAAPDALPQAVARIPDSPAFDSVLGCMDVFEGLAAQQFQSMPSSNSVRDRMYDVGSRAGVPAHISARAADEANASYAQPAMFAMTIAELGTSIRGMRQGNLEPYHRSMAYQQATMANQVLNLYRSLGLMNETGIDMDAFLNYVRLAGFVYTHAFVASVCH